MEHNFLNWTVLDLLLNTVKEGYNNVKENPGQVAELDQKAAQIRNVLEITGVKSRDFTNQDLYMLLYAICMTWFAAIKSYEADKISRETLDEIYVVIFDVSYGIINAVAPILMRDLREYINYDKIGEEEDDWDEWDD